MLKNTDSANTTQYSPLNIRLQNNDRTISYTCTFDTYISAIFKKAVTEFGIPESDWNKYQLCLGETALFKSARLFDIPNVKEDCILVLNKKK